MSLFDLSRTTPVGFEAFWAIWPRKLARKAAERSWKSAVKRAPEASILAGAQAYADGLGNTEAKFVLHAATFLNQDRWEDYGCGTLSHPDIYESPERKQWKARLSGYRPGGYWPSSGIWGPRPGEIGFQGPKDLESLALSIK